MRLTEYSVESDRILCYRSNTSSIIPSLDSFRLSVKMKINCLRALGSSSAGEGEATPQAPISNCEAGCALVVKQK